ncbi:MAG: hypothetical protein WBL05_03595 [Brooklawnia sp.]|uniref:hypothetical protein n=1 Tax=Brooklawnia sp. TaxID=2699740 RepID=UPI003C74C391
MAVPPFRLTAAEAAELRQIVGRRPTIMVAARNDRELVAVLPDRMAVRRVEGWQLVAWVDIQRGGWNADRNGLYWELVDGTRGEIRLEHPGQVPGAFAERVRASIVMSRQVTLQGGLGTVMVTGRRAPGSNEPIVWQAEGLGRLDLGDPRVQSQVLTVVADLRAEYE